MADDIIPRCTQCGQPLEGKDRDRSTCHDCRSPQGKLADLDIAIRASGDDPDRLPEWPAIRHVLRDKFGGEHSPETLWERFTDLLLAGGIAPNEYLVYPLGAASVRKLISLAEETAEAASDAPTPKRRGRRKADYATVQKEAALAAEWERARDAGIYKSDFAKDKGMTVKQLDALLDRVAKRKHRSE